MTGNVRNISYTPDFINLDERVYNRNKRIKNPSI